MPASLRLNEDLATMKAGLQRLQEQLLDLSQQAVQMSEAISRMIGEAAEPQAAPAQEPDLPATREVTVVDSWTSLTPVAMKLGTNQPSIEVGSSRDVFRAVVLRLYEERPQDIVGFIHAKSRTNPKGFGRSPEGMHSPFRVQDDAFVSLCQSANDFRGHLKMMLGFVQNYSPTMLKVSVATDLIDAEPAVPEGGTLVWS
jgi:hypothetical protein